MQPFETIVTDKTVIACDGSTGAMGHPRVFLNMGTGDEIICPYCSRRFVRQGAAGAGSVAGSVAGPMTGTGNGVPAQGRTGA